MSDARHGITVMESHPVQYHAPLYRLVQARHDIPVTAIYASDFSVSGYLDREFGVSLAWDTDLLSGYTPVFLGRVADGGASSAESAGPRGAGSALASTRSAVTMVLGYGSRFDRGAAATALGARRPIIFRGEATDHARSRGGLRALLRDTALRAFYRRAGRLLYVGERARAHYLRLGVSPERLVFSPYGVDDAPFRCAPPDRDALRGVTRAELDIAPDRFVLLYSGKLSERKGVKVLMAALKAADPAFREQATLVLLGDGALGPALAAAATAAPTVDIRLVGFRNQRALSGYFHAADALVLPSISGETWGLVVNEGLLHGLPCVVSDAVGSAPDLVVPGVTGEVAETGRPDSLLAAIRRVQPLASDPSTAGSCRELAQRYSLEHAADGIARAYWALAESGPHP